MPRRRRTRVLVVDEWVRDREAFADALEAAGYLVSTVASAREALRELTLATPDVVVVDLALPELGAASLLAYLRRRGLRHVRSIVVTAYEASTTRRLLAPDAVLEKPVGTEALLAAVAELEPRDERASGA
jgi:CheY-like chemotaxis protein